jgi:hypothetical protein
MPFQKGNPYRFQKGHPGGPGRPSRDELRKRAEAYFQERMPFLLQALEDAVCAGNVAAITLAMKLARALPDEKTPVQPTEPTQQSELTPEELAAAEKQARVDAGMEEHDG